MAVAGVGGPVAAALTLRDLVPVPSVAAEVIGASVGGTAGAGAGGVVTTADAKVVAPAAPVRSTIPIIAAAVRATTTASPPGRVFRCAGVAVLTLPLASRCAMRLLWRWSSGVRAGPLIHEWRVGNALDVAL
jgi:hypothetical protein